MNLFSLIIKSYSHIILMIGAISLVLFSLGLRVILKPARLRDQQTFDDFNAIAGDDVFATQLDLARAYLETGNAPLAKSILKSVAKQGSAKQREEAKRLLRS